MSVKPHCKPNQAVVGVCCVDHERCVHVSRLLETDAFSWLDPATLPSVSPEKESTDLYLRCDHSGFSLLPQDHGSGAVVTAFADGATNQRAKRGKQLLVKAIGGGELRPTVVDATAGLGRDAALLHAFDFPVIMLERNPVLHALLARDVAAVSAAPRLFHSDANDWLRAPPTDLPVDVVYLDPMFSESRGAAAVKKELGYLRRLLAAEAEDAELLDAAMAAARYRVVVKRAIKARPFAERPPNFSVRGKAIRFDVYALQAYPRATSNRSSTPA